jgi:hypothetical protein
MIKLVENNHYHLWSDALHARSLAHQARNKWDRGTYVRWCITTAWTVLEMACQDALEDNQISYRFKQTLDKAIENKSLPKLNWGSGIWQKVTKMQKLRNDYIHRFANESKLFPEANVADNAIDVIRKAVTDIYLHTGNDSPKWILDDKDPGWDKGSSFARATVIRKGANPDDPQTIRIKYIYKGREHESEILPPDADWQKYYEEFLEGIRAPISKIIVYRGSKILKEASLPIRGN